jgi:GNAT superfamily N-acetyltransferase
MSWIDFTPLVKTDKVPSLCDAQLVYTPDFDPSDMPSAFLNVIVRNSRVVFSYAVPDVLIGIWENSAFFTVTGNFPIGYGDGKHTYGSGINCLKSIYVMKDKRGQGVQSRLLEFIGSMCEIAKEPCLSFVKPYELPVLANGNDLESALRGVLSGSELVTYNNPDLKENQRARFESHGWTNMEWSLASVTRPEDHYWYIPKEIKDEMTRKIVVHHQSRLIA